MFHRTVPVSRWIAVVAVAALASPLGLIITPAAQADSVPLIAATAEAGSSFTDEELLAPVGGAVSDRATTNLLSADEEVTVSGNVTVIVQLEDGSVGIPWYRSLFGTSDESRHDFVKEQIGELVDDLSETLPHETPQIEDDGQGPEDETSSPVYEPVFEEVADYFTALDGFAVTIPAASFSDVEALEGVKTIFPERLHEVPVAPENTGDIANATSLAMTGADQTSQRGDGQVIAVIDSGLDVGHEAFTGDLDDDRVALTEARITELKRTLHAGAAGRYVSEKIPFVYDYADRDDDVTVGTGDELAHGTHVAGIAAANGGEIRGTAPNAQLMMLKVAQDSSGAIPDSVLLSALDDAALMGPDVINLSLGIDAGFSDPAGTVYSEVYAAIDERGITLNAAGGNAYSSALRNKSGQDLPFASDPDSSMIGEPAAYGSAVAVASVDNAVGLPSFTASDGRRIGYVQASGANDQPVAPFSGLPDGSYPYVDAGIGSAQDAEDLAGVHVDGLSGSIALIRRGGVDEEGTNLSFEDKMRNIADRLAPTAVVFYDDRDSRSLPVPGIDNTLTPAVIVSHADGEALLVATDRVLTITQGQFAEPSTDYVMSEFSSWGVTPDLKLKPEISAPGGGIHSALPGGRYGSMSGTSMATPQMAGISALVREHLDEHEDFASLSEAERSDLVTQLLMGTAVPLVDVSAGTDLGDGSGVSYFSPRKQGAGIANAVAATSSTVYPTVDDAEQPSRPKADLGHGTNGWAFTVTLHNVGDTDQSYTLDTAALSDQITEGLFQQRSMNWTGRGVTISYGADANTSDNGDARVRVASDSTASVEVRIDIEDDFAQFAADNAPNGTFLDGFTLFTAEDKGGVNLTVPFLGFYGDWGQPPVFDAAYWEGASHIYSSALANSNTGLPLGLNPLDEAALAGGFESIDPERFVVSGAGYDSAPNKIQPVTGTLRSVEKLQYSYSHAAGDVVRSYSYDNAYKSQYNQRSGQVTYVEAKLGTPLFDGLDASGKQLPEGRYTLTQTATTAGPGADDQTRIYGIDYDLTGPQISDLRVEPVDGVSTVTFTVRENTWLSAIDFHEPTTGGWFYRLMAPEPETEEDGQRVYRFSVPVPDIQTAWNDVGLTGDLPDTVPLYAWDYGLNPSAAAQTIITPVGLTSLEVSPEAASLAPGQNLQLQTSHLPENATETQFVWASSDETVVAVSETGRVTGVGEGSADVVVASAADPALHDTATITVSTVPEETGILLSDAELTVSTGGSGVLTALLSPTLDQKDTAVEWTSSDEHLLTVSSGKNGREGELRALRRSGDVTVTATATSADGRSVAATAQVQVRPADYADYVIDENGVLQFYRGSAVHVTIPGNVTAIADDAFRGAPAEIVNVPPSVERIGDRVFQDTPRLRTITFEDTDEDPSRLTTIGADLVKNTLQMDEVHLPRSVTGVGAGAFSSSTIKRVSLPAGVTTISDYMFGASPQLSEVTISDAVTHIGNGAFSAGISLSELTIIAADETRTGLPSALQTIGDGAFAGTKFTSFVLPSGVTSVGSSAFELVPAGTIDLNDGLQSIGARAFSGTSVTELVVPDSVSSVGAGAFSAMPEVTRIRVGDNVGAGDLVGGFAGSRSLEQILLDDDAVNYTSIDDVLFNKDATELVAYPAAKSNPDRSYTVPEGVLRIVEESFLNVPLERVAFPDSLKSIGRDAFSSSALIEVVLPEGFEDLGVKAFQGMSGLRRVDLGGTIVVGAFAFDSDSTLTEVDMRPDLERLVEIQKGAFGNVPLTVLHFPDSLIRVGEAAFANNPTLQEVHIGAGLTEIAEAIFTGSNGLRVLTVSESNPVYSADQNVLYGKKDDGLHLLLSLPTNEFTAYEVKPGTVQIDDQAFRNNSALERVVLPDGLKRLGTGAFNNNSALREVVFPDSIEHVDGFYFTEVTSVDLGTKVKTVAENAFMGRMPEHVIVRGGQDGSFVDSMDFDGTDQKSAFFGEGVTSVTYSYGMTPTALVLPSSLTSLMLSTYSRSGEGVTVYVAGGEGGAAWKVAFDELQRRGFDPSTQLVPYETLTARVLAPQGDLAPGTIADVTALVSGGVPSGQEIRLVEVSPDGSERELQGWTAAADVTLPVAEVPEPEVLDQTDHGDAAQTVAPEAATGVGLTFVWEVPTDGSTLRAFVRDATQLTAQADLGFASAPVLTRDLTGETFTVLEGHTAPELSVEAAEPADGSVLSYQWYSGDAPIEDAVTAAYTPENLGAGLHEFHVVVSLTANGFTSSVVSRSAFVDVRPRAALPIISQDLPARSEYTVGDVPKPLSIVAETVDEGVLSYQWTVDGVNIEGATRSAYVPTTDEPGEHIYLVRVTNTLGTSASSIESAATVVAVAEADGGPGPGTDPGNDTDTGASDPAGGSGGAGGSEGSSQQPDGLAGTGAAGVLGGVLTAALLLGAGILLLARRSFGVRRP